MSPSVKARKPNTEAGRALRDHIVRLDYGAYDAARCLMVDDLGADPGSIGEPWEEALRLIEDQAVARAVKAFPLMASALTLIASEAQQNGNWAAVRYWANEAVVAAENERSQ